MAWGCLPWLCGSLRDAEHRHEALQAATAGPAAPKAAAQQATVTVETYVDALAEQKERWAKLARRGKRKPMFPIREEQEGAPAIDTCAKPGSPNDSDSSSLTPSTTDRDTSPPFSPQSKPHQTPKGLSAFHHVGDVDSDSDDYAARPYLMSGTGVANVKAAQRSARRNRQYKRRTIATATPCMILEPDSGPLAATVQQQARQDNRLAYTLSEEYDTMHTQHLPLSTAQPQARLTQSTTSPLYSHVPHVSASRHDDAWGACVHAKQTRTLQHGPSTGTSGVPPCSVRQGHAMRAASEGGLGHRTGQGSHTAVGTACTAARSTCRSGSAGGALQGAAVCGDATGSELTIIRKCGQGAFGAVFEGRWQGGMRVAVKVLTFNEPPGHVASSGHTHVSSGYKGAIKSPREGQASTALGVSKMARMAVTEMSVSELANHPNLVPTYKCEVRCVPAQREDESPYAHANTRMDMVHGWLDTCRGDAYISKGPSSHHALWELRLIMAWCDKGTLHELLQHTRHTAHHTTMMVHNPAYTETTSSDNYSTTTYASSLSTLHTLQQGAASLPGASRTSYSLASYTSSYATSSMGALEVTGALTGTSTVGGIQSNSHASMQAPAALVMGGPGTVSVIHSNSHASMGALSALGSGVMGGPGTVSVVKSASESHLLGLVRGSQSASMSDVGVGALVSHASCGAVVTRYAPPGLEAAAQAAAPMYSSPTCSPRAQTSKGYVASGQGRFVSPPCSPPSTPDSSVSSGSRTSATTISSSSGTDFGEQPNSKSSTGGIRRASAATISSSGSTLCVPNAACEDTQAASQANSSNNKGRGSDEVAAVSVAHVPCEDSINNQQASGRASDDLVSVSVRSQDSAFTSPQSLSASQQSVSTSQHSALASQESVSVSQESVSVSQHSVCEPARSHMCPSGLTFETVVLTALDIARGVAALHAHSIVHTDLKTQNVMLSTDTTDPRGWVARLGDYGLAVRLPQGATFLSGVYHGSPAYQAPEVRSHGKVFKASDAYSFGILMWELYTGRFLSEELRVKGYVSDLYGGQFAGPRAHTSSSSASSAGRSPPGVSPKRMGLWDVNTGHASHRHQPVLPPHPDPHNHTRVSHTPSASAALLKRRSRADKVESYVRRLNYKVWAPVFPKGTPQEYETLVRSCLQGNPFLRPTFESVIDGLGRLLSSAQAEGAL